MQIARNVVLAFLLTTGLASATLITFDDLAAPPTGGATVPNGYHGLNWVNFFYLDQDDSSLTPSGYQNGTVSSPHVGASSHDINDSQISGAFFDFNSAYMTGAWYDDLNIRVTGYLLGALIYDTTVQVDTSPPTLFNFNYLGVDTVIFDTFGGTPGPWGDHGPFVAMDNITVTQPGTVQGVPESGSSALLLGAAILAIVLLRARILQQRVVS